jgi:hypothetical protein
MDELPCDTKTLLECNFTNLSNTIEFLYKYLTKHNVEIGDLRTEVNKFKDLKSDLEEFKIKFQVALKTIKEIQNSTNSFIQNFLQMDQRFKDNDSRLERIEKLLDELNKNMKINDDKVHSHEDNLNNLNRVVENNIKEFEKEKETIKNNQNEINNIKNDNKNFMNDIYNNKNDILQLKQDMETSKNNLINLNNTVTENNNTIMNNINDINNQNKENLTNFSKKLVDMNSNINTIFASLKDINSKLNMPSVKQIETSIDVPQFSETKFTLKEATPLEIKSNITDNNTQQVLNYENPPKTTVNAVTKVDEMIETNLISTSTNQAPVQSNVNTNTRTSLHNVTTVINTQDNSGGSNINSAQINNIIQKLNALENSSNINKNIMSKDIGEINKKLILLQKTIISGKTGVDPFEGLTYAPTGLLSTTGEELSILGVESTTTGNVPSAELKKLTDNFRALNNTLETKANKNQLDTLEKNLQIKIDDLNVRFSNTLTLFDNKLKTIQALNNSDGKSFDLDSFMHTIDGEIEKKIKEYGFKIVSENVVNCDLSKHTNINELKEILNQHKDELDKAFESIVDIRKDLIGKKFEEDVNNLLYRMNENDNVQNKIQIDIEEIRKQLEGDNNDEENGSKGLPIRETINILNQKLNILSENSDSLRNRVDNISREILSIVKRDLKAESNRILEEFKGDLKLSISKIEDQLKEKVDRFGLAEFGQKINNKFGNDLRGKLDKTDLNRNNHYINRKIDNLENKISRTLVDTLIDLQMDEAPLMVKKNMANVEKCASCNQPLPPNSGYYINRSVDFTNNGNNNNNGGSFNNVNNMYSSSSRFKNTGKYVISDNNNKEK